MTAAHRGLIGVAGLLWALPGCFNPSPPSGVQCAPDGWCPSGQQCDSFTWQCFPGNREIDAGVDAGWPWPWPDAACPWCDAGGPRVGIDEALLSYGPVDIQIPQVLVTYIKPATLWESAGFFVQSDLYGPALYVGVDPNIGGTRLAVGDRISFRLFEMSDIYGLPMALNISNVIVHRRGEDVSTYLQDVNDTDDLTYNSYRYAAELVTARVRIDELFYSDPFGDSQLARVATDAIAGDVQLQMRVTNALQETAGLTLGCTLRLPATPVWSYYGDTQFLAYELSDLRNVDCPPPQIDGITADTGTAVRIQLSRALDPATVASNGSQLVFESADGNAITATSVVLSGRFLNITTTPQSAGALYTLSVDQSLRDVFGRSFAPGVVASFQGGSTRAGVRINEIKTNIVPGCDLLELRVVEPGNLSGFDVRVQTTEVLTFGNLPVERDDLVVVHFDSNDGACRRAGSADETLAPNQQPRSSFPANFDTAFDWYTARQGPTDGGTVVAVRDDQDRIIDAVMLTDNSSTNTTAPTDNAAELVTLANQWRAQGGDVPPGGFTGPAFHANAVPGIDHDLVNVTAGFDALQGARSVQRRDNADTDDRDDWTSVAQSFGALNPGQSPL